MEIRKNACLWCGGDIVRKMRHPLGRSPHLEPLKQFRTKKCCSPECSAKEYSARRFEQYAQKRKIETEAEALQNQFLYGRL